MCPIEDFQLSKKVDVLERNVYAIASEIKRNYERFEVGEIARLLFYEFGNQEFESLYDNSIRVEFAPIAEVLADMQIYN